MILVALYFNGQKWIEVVVVESFLINYKNVFILS